MIHFSNQVFWKSSLINDCPNVKKNLYLKFVDRNSIQFYKMKCLALLYYFICISFFGGNSLKSNIGIFAL